MQRIGSTSVFPVRQSLKCTDSTLSGYRPDVAGRFRARPTPASASCLDLSMRHRVNASVASGVSHYCNADDRLQSTTNKPQTRAQHGIGDRRTPQTYAVSRFPARTRRLNLLRLVAYPRSVSVIEILRQIEGRVEEKCYWIDMTEAPRRDSYQRASSTRFQSPSLS